MLALIPARDDLGVIRGFALPTYPQTEGDHWAR
jgi:hypothetical protein